MRTRTFCSMVLVAALISLVQFASAQDYQGTPKPTIQDYGPFGNNQVKKSSSVSNATGKCGNPAGNCLFYGGDFVDNPLAPPFIPNGLANETTTFISGSPYGAAVWVPFTVPNGKTWNVKALFTNNLSSYGVLDQLPAVPEKAAFWSINEGTYPGNAGTVIASGTNAATINPTGRAAFDLTEYTVEVTGMSVILPAGEYWMAVVPLCTNTGDPFCEGVFFLSDVEYVNTTPANAAGPSEPQDAAFFDSPLFGLSFDPPNGAVGACGGDGCDAFSAGALGQSF